MDISIRAGTFYDGTDAKPRTNVTLTLADGRILAVNDAQPGEDTTYTAACLVPGLINCHAHLDLDASPDTQTSVMSRPPIQLTLDAVRHARLAVQAGVTTIRELGGVGNAVPLRDAIARGEHVGPTIVAANRAICMTGGHGGFVGRLTDGPWDARKAVREQYAAGAACIKLIATGGVLTKGAVPGQDQLSEEEMRAAIREAHTHNLRVAAHAIGANGIKNALRAGVDSIEHGHFVDEEGIGLFLERKAYLVPTLAALTQICEHAQGGGLPDYVVRKATEIREHAAVNIGKAWRAGVPIAGGSDAGTPFNRHEDYAYEVELMSTLLGMTPQQALTAATSTAAQLIDVDSGVLEPGRPADVLLLVRDIADDIRTLRSVQTVIKGGAVVHQTA